MAIEFTLLEWVGIIGMYGGMAMLTYLLAKKMDIGEIFGDGFIFLVMWIPILFFLVVIVIPCMPFLRISALEETVCELEKQVKSIKKKRNKK